MLNSYRAVNNQWRLYRTTVTVCFDALIQNTQIYSLGRIWIFLC